MRPQYQIPLAATEAVNTARSDAYNTRLPGSDYISGKIGANAAAATRMALEAGRTPAEIMATAAAAQGNESDALQKLAIEGLNNNNTLHGQLINELNNYSQWQNAANKYDKYDPYDQSVKAKADLIQAGNENIYSAMKNIGGAASNAVSGIKTPRPAIPNPIQGMAPTTVGEYSPIATGAVQGMAPTTVGPISAIPNDPYAPTDTYSKLKKLFPDLGI